MEYPKPVMNIKELAQMGFPKTFLMDAYYEKGQMFAQKANPLKKTSPIIFDTEAFDEWRLKRLKMENNAIHRR